MLALAEPGLCRREHLMAGRAQPVRDPAPAPAAVPGAVNQHECLRRGLRRRRAACACRQTCDSHCFQDIPTFHDGSSLVMFDCWPGTFAIDRVCGNTSGFQKSAEMTSCHPARTPFLKPAPRTPE